MEHFLRSCEASGDLFPSGLWDNCHIYVSPYKTDKLLLRLSLPILNDLRKKAQRAFLFLRNYCQLLWGNICGQKKLMKMGK